MAGDADVAVVRAATAADEDAVLGLLGADPITRARVDGPWPDAAQRAAFAALLADPRTTLLVADRAGAVVGTLTLTFLADLALGGGDRAQLESVHVAASEQGRGTGTVLVRDAIDRARDRGCAVVQLTSSAERTDARRFYERLGFAASHVGFKRAP